MDSRIVKNRIRKIRRQLKKQLLDCLIVTKPANVTYVTGFGGDDSWAIITRRSVYLLTDSRYIEQAENQCAGCKIIQRTGPMTKAVATLMKRLKLSQSAAVEKSISLAAYDALKKQLKARLKTVGNIIEAVRSCKDPNEIAAIKKAALIAAKALEQTVPYLKRGISENELAGMLDFQIRKLEASNSFDTIVAFGSNASRPHHQPGTRKLRKNDSILIDFGVKYKGYSCDLTRCFAVGRPTALYKKVYEAVRHAQAAAIKMIMAGVKFSKIDAAAKEVLRKHDLPLYGHGTGHGLGLEVHEEPAVSGEAKGKLQAGMVLTIEPAVYIPGKLGVRIEDDVLVTQNGCKILSCDCPQLHLFST